MNNNWSFTEAYDTLTDLDKEYIIIESVNFPNGENERLVEDSIENLEEIDIKDIVQGEGATAINLKELASRLYKNVVKNNKPMKISAENMGTLLSAMRTTNFGYNVDLYKNLQMFLNSYILENAIYKQIQDLFDFGDSQAREGDLSNRDLVGHDHRGAFDEIDFISKNDYNIVVRKGNTTSEEPRKLKLEIKQYFSKDSIKNYSPKKFHGADLVVVWFLNNKNANLNSGIALMVRTDIINISGANIKYQKNKIPVTAVINNSTSKKTGTNDLGRMSYEDKYGSISYVPIEDPGKNNIIKQIVDLIEGTDVNNLKFFQFTVINNPEIRVSTLAPWSHNKSQ